jgi:hypothetical protein
MNTGLLGGLHKRQWVDYQPKLDVWSNGAATPVIGSPASGGVTVGRYLYVPELNLVRYDFLISFALSGNSSGSGYYLVSLPVPCKLQMGGLTGLNSAEGADRFIGTGHVSQGFFRETPNVSVLAMPGDFYGLTYGGRREDWAQFFCPYIRTGGSSSLTSATSVTITFPNTLTAVPLASDIVINWTSTPTNKVPWITGLSTTGFTLNVSTAITATFDWKCIADNSLLVGSNAPWAFAGGDTIKGTLCYETDK